MPLPKPEVGLVIRFNYLWRRERDKGRDNARYPRPCAIILSHRRATDGLTIVMVAPISIAGSRRSDARPTCRLSASRIASPSWPAGGR